MPSTETSPRPWHIGESISGTMSCVFDANGEHIASCFGMPTEADAALIVDAVNERDRLREIVRTFADVTHSLIANYEHRYRDDQNSLAYVANVRELIREARTAIGEETI